MGEAPAPPSFERVRALGSGGMGEVYLARMRRGDGRPVLVALKRLRPGLLDQAEIRDRFQREALAYRLLEHPNVVQLLDSGEDDEGPWLALGYVKGMSASRLAECHAELDRPLPLAAGLCLVRDVAAALAYAHSRGVLHRDVSPDNVLLGDDGVARLADFGIARLEGMATLTRTGLAQGKLGFMAPELFDGAQASVQSDVYSFAATTFRMLCGVMPFRGRTEAEVLKAVMTAEPPSFAALRRDAPAGLSAFMAGGLARNPADRPAGLRPLVEALEGLGVGKDRTALVDALEAAVAHMQGATTRIAHLSSLGQAGVVTGEPPGLTGTAEVLTTAPHAHGRGSGWTPGRTKGAAAVAIAVAAVAGVLIATGGGPEVAPGQQEADGVRAGSAAIAADEGDQQEADEVRAQPGSAGISADEGAQQEADEVLAQFRVANGPEREGTAPGEHQAGGGQPGRDPARAAEQPAGDRSGATAVRADAAPAPPRSAVRAPPSTRRPSPAKPREGRLEVKVRPWARVYVNGEFRGVTPFEPLRLSAGKHSVILVNEKLGVRQVHTVAVEPGLTRELRVLLD